MLALALLVTVVGGAGIVCCEVVSETVLARVTPREALGRVAGLFDASSIGAMVGGAVLASILIRATSLRSSFWILGAGTVLVALTCVRGLRGLDEASRKRTEALASRLAIIERLPITQGTPQLVLEQLASSSQLCPLPPGVDVVVQGSPAHAFYAVVGWTRRRPSRRGSARALWAGRRLRRAWAARQRAPQRHGDDGDGHDRAADRRSGPARVARAGADVGDRARPQQRPGRETNLVDDPRWADA